MTQLEFLLLPPNRILSYWRVPLGIFNELSQQFSATHLYIKNRLSTRQASQSMCSAQFGENYLYLVAL